MNIKVIFSRLKLKEQKDKKEPFKKILIKLLIKQKKLKIQPNKQDKCSKKSIKNNHYQSQSKIRKI